MKSYTEFKNKNNNYRTVIKSIAFTSQSSKNVPDPFYFDLMSSTNSRV